MIFFKCNLLVYPRCLLLLQVVGRKNGLTTDHTATSIPAKINKQHIISRLVQIRLKITSLFFNYT